MTQSREQLGPAVVDILSRLRLAASCETDIQESVMVTLDKHFPTVFHREWRLNASDRPDFFAPTTGTVVEVKWSTKSGGALAKVLRQLARYADDNAVKEIVFASPIERVVNNLPKTVRGIPLRSVLLMASF